MEINLSKSIKYELNYDINIYLRFLKVEVYGQVRYLLLLLVLYIYLYKNHSNLYILQYYNNKLMLNISKIP